ncbi:MAG: hypothetical protein ABMA64_15940 [Myxococcota bacterium]
MSERKRPRAAGRGGGLRGAIAREAAQLMYDEAVGQYFDAKRIAARRVAEHDRLRARDLPSNGEIREALLELVSLAEGPERSRRLFAMRVEALVLLRELEPWQARLIGSVASGHARRGSDIDVHVFGELDALCADLDARGWAYDSQEVLVRAGGDFRSYHHLYVVGRPFPVELSVYPWEERRIATRSSVDGRPIDRVSARRLEERLRQEHAFDFARWERTGELEFEEETPRGPFGGVGDRPERG